jgi:O-antigen/teichoic acid export membrane protein
MLWQVLAFVSLPLLVSQVGAANFGIYALAAASIGYFSILSLPARQAVMKFTSEHLSNSSKVAQVFSNALILNVLTGVFIAAVLLSVAVYADSLFNIEPQDLQQGRILLLAYAFAALVTQPLSVFGSLLYGIQDYRPIATTTAVGAITRFLMILAIYFFDGSIYWFAAHEIAFEIATGLYLARVVRRRIERLRFSWQQIDRQGLKMILGYGGLSVLYTLALVIITQGNRIVIGVLLPVAAITYFHIASMLYNLINTLASYIRTAVLPSASAAMADGDHSFVQKMITSGTRVSLGITLPVCLHILVFADSIISFWMGPEYATTSTNLSRIILLSWLFMLPTFLLLYVYWAQREIAALSLAALFGSVLQIGLLFVLVPQFGIEGAGAATLAFYILLAPIQLYIMGRKLDFKIWEFIRRVVMPSYGVNLLYVGVLLILRRYTSIPENLTELMGVFAVSLAINIGLCFLTVSRTEGRFLVNKILASVRATPPSIKGVDAP